MKLHRYYKLQPRTSSGLKSSSKVQVTALNLQFKPFDKFLICPTFSRWPITWKVGQACKCLITFLTPTTSISSCSIMWGNIDFKRNLWNGFFIETRRGTVCSTILSSSLSVLLLFWNVPDLFQIIEKLLFDLFILSCTI